MSIPSFSAFPEIPQRSTPEADFDAKMYALFQHFSVTHRNELLAFIHFLENNVTAIEGAINGVTIGLTHPAAAKFTSLAADSISGAAVQATSNDATPGKVMKVGAFGLGAKEQPSLVGDVFQNSATGLYYPRPPSVGGATDTPYNGNFNLLKFQKSPDYQAALLIPQVGGFPRVFAGLSHGGVQYPWGEALLYNEDRNTPYSFGIANSSPLFLLKNTEHSVQHFFANQGSGGGLYIEADSSGAGASPAIAFNIAGQRMLSILGSGSVRPGADNAQPLGFSSYRWSQIYATTGTINTSDVHAKQDIQDLDAAECRVAVVAKGLLKKYRMRDAVAKKGDTARWHFGIIAQELAAAFEAEGLDPWRYGVLCWDEWWSAEVEIPAETAPITDENGAPTGEVKTLVDARTELQTFDRAEEAPEGAEYHNRQGVRYDELFAFILAAL